MSDPMLTPTPLDHADTEIQRSIDICLAAHRACVNAIGYCVEKNDEQLTSGLLRILMDAAEITQTTANFMLRGSTLHDLACNFCCEVAEKCAWQCERFEEDSVMKACAAACRRAADACRAHTGAVVAAA